MKAVGLVNNTSVTILGLRNGHLSESRLVHVVDKAGFTINLFGERRHRVP